MRADLDKLQAHVGHIHILQKINLNHLTDSEAEEEII